MLIRLLAEWRANLDQNKIIRAVLLGFSEAFDCIPHDLLIANLNAYEFDRESLKLIYSYLKGRKQFVCINNIYSNFLQLLSSVPQGSILGALKFNIFSNHLFLFIKKGSLLKYADYDTYSFFQMLHS